MKSIVDHISSIWERTILPVLNYKKSFDFVHYEKYLWQDTLRAVRAYRPLRVQSPETPGGAAIAPVVAAIVPAIEQGAVKTTTPAPRTSGL